MNMNLANRLVLITGASRGIGKAIAQAFGEEGAIVVGTATSATGAEAISQFLQQQGFQGQGMALDITQVDQISALLDKIQAEYQRSPEILVNNAGITQDNILMRMKEEEWEHVIDTNLSGVF